MPWLATESLAAKIEATVEERVQETRDAEQKKDKAISDLKKEHSKKERRQEENSDCRTVFDSQEATMASNPLNT
jgi:hypothetical protein